LGTAYDGHRSGDFQRLVEEFRRRAVDEAIGKMSKNLGKAVEKIVELVEKGTSESVQLSAAKTLIDKLLQVQSQAELKDEIRRLDERLAAAEAERESGRRKSPGAGRPA
jgi:hypothetical protein